MKQAIRYLVGVLVLVALLFGINTLAQGPSLPPGSYDLEEGEYIFNVPALAVTATAPAPTNTAIPPTATAIPPTATSIPPTATSPVGHDNRAWHPLTEEFAHEHKMNPHAVNDIFGTEFYSWAGGEISYPWETPDENLNKHEGYGWVTYDASDYGHECFATYADNCVMAFRLQYHAIMAAHGAVTRFHSYWLEVLVCDEANPDVCGIVRHGGWADFGCLIVDDEYVPLPGDPETCGNNRRIHALQLEDGEPLSGGANTATWYSKQVFALPAIRGEVWGGVDPNDPFTNRFVCPDYQCGNNGSHITAHIISGSIAGRYDSDGDGLADFEGYTDRYGKIVEGCIAIGLDCIPLRLEGVPVGYYQWREDSHPPAGIFEGDISPPGEFWIRYPN